MLIQLPEFGAYSILIGIHKQLQNIVQRLLIFIQVLQKELTSL